MKVIVEPKANFAGLFAAENLPKIGRAYALDTDIQIGLTKRLDGISNRIWNNARFDISLGPQIHAVAQQQDEPNWGVLHLGAEWFWSQGLKGQRVKIGILDSGMDPSHAALTKLRLQKFARFDLENGRLVELAPIEDSHFHGTHVVAILAGVETGSNARGMAPEAEICFGRVLDGTQGSVASFKAGFNWLVDCECDIVSLSIGWEGLHDEWADDIERLARKSVVVAAAGNEFGLSWSFPSRSPANYPIEGVIAVGATDRQDKVWRYSGGEKVTWRPGTAFSNKPTSLVPTIVAPGVEIVSAAPGGLFWSTSGTSMATPHVAGLLALILSGLRNKQAGAPARAAVELLLSCTRDLGDSGVDTRFGSGIVDVDKLQKAMSAAIS